MGARSISVSARRTGPDFACLCGIAILSGLAPAPTLAASTGMAGPVARPAAEAGTTAGRSAAAAISVGMPAEFAALARDQQVVADFYFGGRLIGQFEIIAAAGSFRIARPDRVQAAIPDIADRRAVAAMLAGTLDTNARFVCKTADAACPRPTPDGVAAVFDSQRFRIDLYLNAKLLTVRSAMSDRYLKQSARGLTMVDTIGGAIAGGSGTPLAYTIRNRTIVGAGNVRLVADALVSSGHSPEFATLAAQVDRPDLRYTAGFFYAPGGDLVGRTRIMGAGVASQFDTRADRTVMTGSPLIIFLDQRARVDLYSEGRLVASHVYEAGNQSLDTSGLPDGAYPVEIRIQEAGGASRTQTSFFSKSATIPPPGRTMFFASAGLVVADRNLWLAPTRTPMAVAGIARRAGAHLAWDVTATATDRQRLAEVGLSFMTRPVLARIALRGAADGTYGVTAQAVSAGVGRLGYNVDLRHMHMTGRESRSTAAIDAPTAAVAGVSPGDGASTSLTQVSANLSYRVGRAQIGASALVQRDDASHYAVGPTIRWAVLQRRRMQLSFDGSYAATNRGRSLAVGLQLNMFGRRGSVNATLGAQSAATGRTAGALARIGGSLQRDDGVGGELSASGDIQTGAGGVLVQASAAARGQAGYGTASIVQRIGAGGGGTQFSLAMQSAVAATGSGLRIGARDQTDSVIAVRLGGGARDSRFQVLVDETPAGFIAPGQHLTIAVTPYRRYAVRIKPVGDALLAFDATQRIVDVYPGSVADLAWRADKVLALFGRLVRPDFMVIADADITTTGAIAATDDRGYFQIQAAHDAVLNVRRADGSRCKAVLAAAPSNKGYTAMGDVICRP